MIDKEKTRAKILELIHSIKRNGIEKLVSYLDQTDFFTAPCSTKYHLACECGLAQHSLNVYYLLDQKCKQYTEYMDIEDESIKICGLMHDLCKTNFYIKTKKWTKVNNQWTEYEAYDVKDQFPLGHGEKSVIILQKFIELKDIEILAIRWHMLAFDAGIHFPYPSGYAFKEASKNPIVVLLFTADYESSQIVETQTPIVFK